MNLIEATRNAARVGWFIQAATINGQETAVASNPTDPGNQWVYVPDEELWMNMNDEQRSKTIPLCKLLPEGDQMSHIMKFFSYQHLPEKLQRISRLFHDLAHHMDDLLPECAEKSAGLRKLLEAKDCMVRANLDAGIVLDDPNMVSFNKWTISKDALNEIVRSKRTNRKANAIRILRSAGVCTQEEATNAIEEFWAD